MIKQDGVFWRYNQGFISDLSRYLSGNRILEVFSGNGYLASLLKHNGINIKPTTLFSSHDCHHLGLHTDVEEIEAEQAVISYGKDFDVLVVCWPTVTKQVLRAIQAWGSNKPIVYIGEKTDLDRGVYGGCATDEFFDNIQINKVFESYKGNIFEIAAVIHYHPKQESSYP